MAPPDCCHVRLSSAATLTSRSDADASHSLGSVVAEDAFTGRLLELSKRVQAEGVRQKAYLGIHRSDYMLHEPQAETPNDTQRLLQVELNTISSSFACISSLVSDLHRCVCRTVNGPHGSLALTQTRRCHPLRSFLISRYGPDLPALASYYDLELSSLSARLPPNAAIRELPDALAAAHAHYGVQEYVSRSHSRL